MHTSTNPAAAASPFPNEGPTDLQPPVVNALTRVVDPEVALSIVEVGSLIWGVTIEAERCWQPAWTPDKPSVRAKRFMQW